MGHAFQTADPGGKEGTSVELWQIVLIVALILAVLAGAAWFAMRQRRTQQLSDRFGPEYRETVEQTGDQRAAERELEARQKRVEKLEIRGLRDDERERYAAQWQSVQARFVDDPAGAISEADRLVESVMTARGYQVGEGFERTAGDVSVNYPQVVGEYRAAHDIAERNARDGVETEELRQAMVHYRALFDELLEDRSSEPVEAPR
jgi:hypothetical protein